MAQTFYNLLLDGIRIGDPATFHCDFDTALTTLHRDRDTAPFTWYVRSPYITLEVPPTVAEMRFGDGKGERTDNPKQCPYGQCSSQIRN